MHLWLVFFLLFIFTSNALDNGLARIPPMGWMSWTRFACDIDCTQHPFSCIDENLYKAQAFIMSEKGYKDVGYKYVHIDDCWTERDRDYKTKRLVPDKQRFKSGIPALADYMHSLGLKLGIYADYGSQTCMGIYPGSMGYEKLDADTFAEWKVDYLKLDGCNSSPEQQAKGYPLFSKTLNESGRSIVYSCSWPAYQQQKEINYTLLGQYCNLWRDYNDIRSKWSDIIDIIDHYVSLQDIKAQTQGPGKWHDPDMIVVGNEGITEGMARVQMTVWSIWSSPLIISNDLRTITPEFEEILQNRRVIAIDQDSLGEFGKLIKKAGDVNFFVKRVTPYTGNNYSYAIAVINFAKNQKRVSFKLGQLGVNSTNGYNMENLWNGEKLGYYGSDDVLTTIIEPADAVFYKATIKSAFSTSRVEGIEETFVAESAF